MILTPKRVREQVRKIAELAEKGDNVEATREEFYLFIDTLFALRDDLETPDRIRELVTEALATRSLTFKRELR